MGFQKYGRSLPYLYIKENLPNGETFQIPIACKSGQINCVILCVQLKTLMLIYLNNSQAALARKTEADGS